MMMQRRHAKNALAGQAKRSHLQNHRKRLQHENPPTKNSRISCLMATAIMPIEPPSASDPTSPMKTSAGCALYQRNPREEPTSAPQKIVSSPTSRKMLDVQIGRETRVAGDVGQNRERARGDHHAANRQTVQAVGEIHRIRRTDNDRHHKNQEWQICQRPEVGLRQAANESPDPDENS